MRSLERTLALPAALLVLPLMAGCAAAAGAAAGAAAAIAYNERGAESQVNASVSEVVAATEAAFTEMGIQLTERELEFPGEEAELEGRVNGRDVAVNIHLTDVGSTHVEVTAKDNMADYEREYAREVLQRIVARL